MGNFNDFTAPPPTRFARPEPKAKEGLGRGLISLF